MATATTKMTLPIENIEIDYQWNVRSRVGKDSEAHYRGISELAADIKRDGLINPVLVKPLGENRYKLIAGFRRMDAVKSLGAKVIDTVIMDVDDARAAVINAKENTSRDSITAYDFAKRCVELRDLYQMTQAKIAAEFAAGQDYQGEGMSRSYIGNLMRCIDNLDAKILAAWRQEDPSLSLALLIKWSAMEKEEQIEAWDALRGKDESEEGGEGDEGEGGEGEGGDKESKKSNRKATTAHMVEAYRAVKNDPKLSESVQDAMLAVFAFALGKTKTLKVGARIVYDPKAEKVKAKAERETRKAMDPKAARVDE